MTDQNETSGRRLRELLGIAPDGKRIHFWSGLDRDKDITALTAAIAVAVPDLINRGGRVVQLRDGDLVVVNMTGFSELVSQYICTEIVVNRAGRWQKEYVPFKFAPARRFDASISGPQPPTDTSAPDAEALVQIYRIELLKFLPKVE